MRRRPRFPLTGGRRKRCVAPLSEPLERRTLLSTIFWVNEGSDSFQTYYGSNAGFARDIVNRAIDDWERLIADFNYSGGGNSFDLTVTAFPYTAAAYTIINSTDADGRPNSGTITIDDNGDGWGWYFDEHIGTADIPDDGEFTDFVNPFCANGDLNGLADFYTTVLHELGHAMGLSWDPRNLRLWDKVDGEYVYVDDTGIPDPDNPGNTLFYYPASGTVIATLTNAGGHPVHGLHLWAGFHPDELMNTDGWTERRNLITAIDLQILHEVYGYTLDAAHHNTFYANLDRITDELTVRGADDSAADPPVASNDTIVIDVLGDDLRVEVNGLSELIPIDQVSTVRVEVDIGDDTVNIKELPAGLSVSVHGGDGDDTIRIGGNDLDAHILGSLSIFDDAGDDCLEIEDSLGTGSDAYTLDAAWFSKSTFAPISSCFEQVILHAGAGDNVINIEDVLPGRALTVYGGDGDDAINLGTGRLGTDIESDVTITGGEGNDTLTLSDEDEFNDHTYAFTAYTCYKPGGTTVTCHGVDAIVLNAGSGDDLFDVDATPASSTLSINAGEGDDTVEAGGGDIAANISADVAIAGGGGNDFVMLNDREGGGEAAYVLDDYSFSMTAAGMITFVGVNSAQLDANDLDNTIRVDAISATVPVTVNGGGGDDTFHVGQNDIVGNIAGPVTLNGGDGADTVSFNDTMNMGADSYAIAGQSFTKTGFTIAVGLSSIESLALYANMGANVIDLPDWTCPVAINGGMGDDTINLGGGDCDDYCAGDVTVNGGLGDDTLFIDDQGGRGEDQYDLDAGSFTKTHFGTLWYSALEGLSITANSESNTINLGATAAGTPVTINGGGGSDTVSVGAGDIVASIGSDLAIAGGGDDDLLNIVDTAPGLDDSYTLTETSFTKTSFGTLVYSEFERLAIQANTGGNMIQVDGVPAGAQVTVWGNSGDDTARVGADDYDDHIAGNVTFSGGDGDDSVVFADEVGDEDDTYIIETGTLRKAAFAPVLSHDGCERLSILANTGNNAIEVVSTGGEAVTIGGGGGDDTIRLSPVDHDLALIAGHVFVAGGGGLNDAIELCDQGTSAGDAYFIDGAQVTRSGFGGLAHTMVEGITLYGQGGDNAFSVTSCAAATPITILGGAGNDEIDLSFFDRDLGDLPGRVTFDGQEGKDGATLYDTTPALGSAYGISSTGVGRPGFGGFIYSGTELLTLKGQPNANTFDIKGTAPGLRLVLEGLNGADTFSVLGTISGPVEVYGGNPAAPPGDKLGIFGSIASEAIYVPGTVTGSGIILYDGQTITYAGLEGASPAVYAEGLGKLTLITPLSSDDLILGTLMDLGIAFIAGQSGTSSLPMLGLTRIANLVINTGEHDGLYDSPGNDTLRVKPEGFAPAGLADFQFIGGRDADGLIVDGGSLVLSHDCGADTESLAIRVNADGAGTATVQFRESQRLRELSIGEGGFAEMAADRGLSLSSDGLAITGTGTLDLRGNELVLTPPPEQVDALLPEVTAHVRRARNSGPAGPWTGPGLTSALARIAANRDMGLASVVALRDIGGNPRRCILVKYTLNGDGDADGVVDGEDFHRLDRAFLVGGSGYADGDFDYNERIDGDDYYLADNAFLAQEAVPPAGMPIDPAASSITAAIIAPGDPPAALLPAATPAPPCHRDPWLFSTEPIL